MAGDDSVTTLDINQARAQLTATAYGKDKADKVKSLRNELQKAQFDARKVHQAALLEVMQKRSDFVKDVDKVRVCVVEASARIANRMHAQFWAKTFQQSQLAKQCELHNVF